MIIKNAFGGIPLIASEWMTSIIYIKLSWWERIKSLKPWIKHRTKIVPNDQVYELFLKDPQWEIYGTELDRPEKHVFIAHPQTIENLRRELDANNSSSSS